MILRAFLTTFVAVLFLALSAWPGAGAAHGADRPDWSSVKGTGIKLFYPGVTSWEFLNSEDHRLGGRGINRGKKDCRHCHLSRDGVLDLKSEEIVTGAIRMKRSHKPFEPSPGPIRKGAIEAVVQAAYDGTDLYVRISWPSEGAAWNSSEPGTLPERVSMQINEKEPLFAKYGCFISCHNSLSSMPDAASPKDVAANPYYRSLKRSDVRLYAVYARDGWKAPKGDVELKRLRSSGSLIDLLSVEIKDGNAKAHDGWILEDRRWEADTKGLEATAGWKGGTYTVVIKRSLGQNGPHDVSIKDGSMVSAAVSVHDSGSEKRKHYVSFPFTIGLGKGGGDVEAVRIK